MKLNEQCMRDILQYCADHIRIFGFGGIYTGTLRIKSIVNHFERLDFYAFEDIYYSLVKLIELKYIIISDNNIHYIHTIKFFWNDETYLIDVSYSGHKYLEKFVDDKKIATEF